MKTNLAKKIIFSLVLQSCVHRASLVHLRQFVHGSGGGAGGSRNFLRM